MASSRRERGEPDPSPQDTPAPYLARYRTGLAWGLTCVLLTNWISLAQPQVLRFAVDDLYKGVTAAKLGRYAVIPVRHRAGRRRVSST
jgi:hypothetical protein